MRAFTYERAATPAEAASAVARTPGAKFIAGGRIQCTIDRVSGKGVIETNRPDDKNKQYQDVVRQGDQLITKLQKYGQVVRMRGSERG